MSGPARQAFGLLLIVAIIIGVLMLLVAAKTSWDYAFTSLIGLASGLRRRAEPFSVLLTLAGYIVVPASIGAATAVLLTRSTEIAARTSGVKRVAKTFNDKLRGKKTAQAAPAAPAQAAPAAPKPRRLLPRPAQATPVEDAGDGAPTV